MDFGFISAQISQGSSVRMWQSVASKFPQNGRDRLFVFPGGVFSSTNPAEAVANYVFKLATPKNLDGAIVWLSSLTGVVNDEHVMDYLHPHLPATLVTISGKTEKYRDIPDVTFDPSYALREITKHMIVKHGISKIAFIRGPEGHISANIRFEAYKAVLSEFNIKYDENLVTPPCAWNRGDFAMRELIVKRKLVPGRDFEAVVCASDLLMVDAAKVLKEAGYNVPSDVKMSGFNDSIESRLLQVPPTTAKMPTAKMGFMAVESLRKKLMGQAFVPDQSLVGQPVFRRSCGCNHTFEKQKFETKTDLIRVMAGYCGISIEESSAIYDRIVSSSTEQSLIEALSLAVKNAEDIYIVNEGIGLIEKLPFLEKEQAQRIVSLARERLPEIVDRLRVEEAYAEQKKLNRLGSFKNDLLGKNRITEIANTLRYHCRALGFEEVYLVLTKEEGVNTCYGDNQTVDFPSDLILPEKDYSDLGPGVYVVFPLHDEATYFGHLLIKTSDYDGRQCSEVAQAVSSAVKAGLFFEETARAKVVAERAEEDRTMFFSNVSENLREPLAEAVKKIRESESTPENEKKLIVDLISGAEKILDLALSKTGELELNTSLERYDVILSQFPQYKSTGILPCLMVDRNKIRDVLNIITGMAKTSEITARYTRQGILTCIRSTDGEPVFKDCSSVDFNLAQNLVYMHKGRISLQDDRCEFTIPYPTLSGREAREINEGESLAVFGNDTLTSFEEVRKDSVVLSNFSETGKLFPDVGAIFWGVEGSGNDSYEALRVIMASEKLKGLPFIICPETWSKTLEDTVRMSVETGHHRILQIGEGAESIYRWIQNPEIINSSMYNAAEMCRDKAPDLVVIADVDEANPDIRSISALIKTIRSMKKVYQTPVLVCLETVTPECVDALASYSNVLLCNYCVLESSEFIVRVRNIVEGDEILPVLTGAIVKKAQEYLCTHACSPISRWQIAENVNVSEDYLTRIFKKELGLSPWDYLNRYRIYLSKKLLRNTAMTINEVSSSTGFQDQAYFCRVFKKITGHSPSKVRSSRKFRSE
ncbi:MAG: helix-turn-helix domain-containing protein [Sphaerochaetaceae bacterium]|nr:helix-turn-helix domain-containing protein [Sphaerochaetaceae bacterium]